MYLHSTTPKHWTNAEEQLNKTVHRVKRWRRQSQRDLLQLFVSAKEINSIFYVLLLNFFISCIHSSTTDGVRSVVQAVAKTLRKVRLVVFITITIITIIAQLLIPCVCLLWRN